MCCGPYVPGREYRPVLAACSPAGSRSRLPLAVAVFGLGQDPFDLRGLRLGLSVSLLRSDQAMQAVKDQNQRSQHALELRKRGAKEIRTPDLLHAICLRHGRLKASEHVRRSGRVINRQRERTKAAVLSCCTLFGPEAPTNWCALTLAGIGHDHVLGLCSFLSLSASNLTTQECEATPQHG
jgi:hypothetical protein